jgi:hypothetical protein
MKLSRVFVLAPFVLLSTGWLHADPLPPTPGHFVINLNDDDSNNTEGSGGWGSGTVFHGTVNPEAPDGGFPTGQAVSCHANSWGHVYCHVVEIYDDYDPHAGTKLGGLSPAIGETFTITSNTAGGGAFDFQNQLGHPITSLELDVKLPDPAAGQTETFTCNGGDAFGTCGFIIAPGDLHVLAFFSDGYIPSVPEPSTWILLGSATVALLGRKALRRG